MSDQKFSRRQMLQAPLVGATIVAASQSGFACEAVAQPQPSNSPAPAGAYAHNVEAVGYTDMEHRPAFKMAIREVRGRWHLYTGHFWDSGWSIVDVTDPAKPQVAKFISYPTPNTWTLQIDLSGDTMATALEKPFANFGGEPDAPFDEGLLVWDIADPLNPQLLSHFKTGANGTHRNLYPGGRYVHVAASMPGYRGNIYLILDISDRANPREAGRWWVPGQHEAGGESFSDALLTSISRSRERAEPMRFQAQCICGAFCSGEDVSLHGPAYVVGNHVYLPYGAAGMIVLDISDVSRPRKIGGLSFSPPFHSRFGVHGVLPVPEQGIAFANSENVTYGQGAAHHASIIDISDPSEPFLLSLLPEPVPPAEAPYADFTTRGGWRGPHNINHHQHHPDVEKQGDLFYIAHFNAGLRIYDVSNRRLPREVGYFIPPEPVRRYGPIPEDKLVLQTEDVVVDRRGFIYISDKNQGIWVLRYIGERPQARRA
ncbi:LVIVD repeat-containing protein [Ensifer sesbaniae]|uniref:LVIVD repeat-containing protein n=1 Tax=Ensifer sesbaniae TaxID=1214071 RepID=UPI003D7F5194